MPSTSSSAVEWSTRLEPGRTLSVSPACADDPRLGELVEHWDGRDAALTSGRAVLVGFPQDEGVCRNGGRPGAAGAPTEIRRWLDRLTPWAPEGAVDLANAPPLDLGDVRLLGDLEATQEALAIVVAALFTRGCVPIVLGGGHETAYGHFLGYVAAGRAVGIVNVDAHLDVRPLKAGRGHSGSPFRQALEHPEQPLPGSSYVCLGAQPHSTSRQHWDYARQRGAIVLWRDELLPSLAHHFASERDRLAASGASVYLTIDADAVRSADVPGVSAPNPAGLPGADVLATARLAGRSTAVTSMDLVEINPEFDHDGQSARWAALVVWNFLIGHACR